MKNLIIKKLKINVKNTPKLKKRPFSLSKTRPLKSFMYKMVAPKITGTAKRKEIFMLASFLYFKANADVIVIPDLDTPRIIAKNKKKPIFIASK